MKKKIVAVLLMVLTLGLLVTSIQPAKAQFVLASWDFPDEYGQGIEGLWIYENSTGDWIKVYEFYHDNVSNIFKWNESVGIKLRCWTLLNATLTGAATKDIGKNYLRHSVVVTTPNGTVFSQQNITFGTALDEALGIYLYGYDVTLGFLPVSGEIYTAVITYEIYY